MQCKSLWIKASVKCINIEFGCRNGLETIPEGLIISSEIFVSMFAAELETFYLSALLALLYSPGALWHIFISVSWYSWANGPVSECGQICWPDSTFSIF